MVLNSIEAKKYISDPLHLAVLQQIGIDLTIEEIKEIKGDNSRYLGVHKGNMVLKEKTIIKDFNKTYLKVEKRKFKVEIEGEEKEIEGWLLEEGAYSLTFNQGCKLDNQVIARIINRSSLNRLGCFINSGIFDSGFETENLGATLYVKIPIFIEYRSRLAQIKIETCSIVSENKLYKGQYQKERDKK